jgi:hypothetical protein
MSESRRDLGYEIPSDPETNRDIRRILDPKSKPDPRHPDMDWQISDQDKEIGRAGIADNRAILQAKRKQSLGEALTPDEVALLAKLYRENSV